MQTMVTLDGSPVSCPEATLHGAIRAGRAAAGSRLIVEVRADGVVVDPDHPDIASTGFSRIEMLSADPIALARVALHDAADTLEEIATVQSDAAGFLQTGETERAMALLMRTREAWGGVVQTIELLSQSGMVPGGEPQTLGGLPVHRAHTRLNACLRSVIETLTAQDHAALADVLAYDLGDLAREWTVDLRRIADATGGAGAHRAGLVA